MSSPKLNPTGTVAHVYVLALTALIAAAFSPLFALIPLAVGFVGLITL